MSNPKENIYVIYGLWNDYGNIILSQPNICVIFVAIECYQ